MENVISCPSCACRLHLPDEALGRQACCPSCGCVFPTERVRKDEKTPPAGLSLRPIVIEEDGVAPRILGVPPPPRPLKPILVGSTQEEPAARPVEGGLERCTKCGARLTRDVVRCPVCNLRLTDEDDRPWERADGPLRRDFEPHRGPLLLNLGRLGVGLSVLGLMGVAYAPLALVSLVASGIGLATYVMAHNDLHDMQRKIMDLEGKSNTESAQTCATISMVIGGAGLLLAIVLRLPGLLGG